MLSRSPWERFRSDRRAVACLLILCAELLAVLLLPPLLGLEPNASDLGAGFWAPPSAAHPLGTDDVGRDLLARLLCGGRVSLLIGLCSNGVHSNGFSLVRKVLLDNPKALDIYVSELGRTIGEELLRPTHIYVKSIQCLRQHGVTVKAISHITGGGLYENVPRMMKEGLTARIRTASYPVPAIFELIQKSGDIPVRDMYNTFNMGIGLVIAIPKDQVGHALDVLARAGEQSYVIGDVIKGDAGVELV